jgi:hypothetical protein
MDDQEGKELVNLFIGNCEAGRGGEGIIHPHLNPLPSREREIKERVFHRAREIMEVVF